VLLISASPLPLCSNHVVLIDPAGLVQHTSNHIIHTTGSTEAQAGLIGCKQFEMSGAAVELRLINRAKVIIEQAAFGFHYKVEAFGAVLLNQYCPVGVVIAEWGRDAEPNVINFGNYP